MQIFLHHLFQGTTLNLSQHLWLREVLLYLLVKKNNYRVLEKTANEEFQALWIEISLVKKKNIICSIMYRECNSPERFQQYFTLMNLSKNMRL